MTWNTTLTALQAWVVSATGIATGNVRWSGQGGTRAVGPWISLNVIADNPAGPTWFDIEDADEPVVAGAEINYKGRGSSTGTLSIQCFAGAAVGESSSVAILRNLRASASSPATRAAMVLAGVGLGTIGPVQDSPGLINTTNFEPRAMLNVTFFTAEESTIAGTYIETVEVDGTVTS